MILRDVHYQIIFKKRLKDEGRFDWSWSNGRGYVSSYVKAGIEVHGYRNNYQKAQEQFEKRVISVDVPLLSKPLFK